MADNSQKNPLVASLNRWANEREASHQQLLGKALPATIVSVEDNFRIVTVKFEIESDTFTFPNIKCSLGGTPKWIRFPIGPGTPGFTVPADIYMGGVTGLGGGVASVEQQGNLTNLVFVPTGNTGDEDNPWPGTTLVYGPEGVVLKDEDDTVIVEILKDKGVMVNAQLGGNCLGANLVQASDDADAKNKGVPHNGFYYDDDGKVCLQRIPD